MFVTPRVGPLWSAVIEAPIMLGVCWVVCGLALRRLHPAASLTDRAAIGALWFGFLLTAEIGVGVFLRQLSLTDTLASFVTPPGLAGLAAQGVCALFPLLRRQRRPKTLANPASAQ
jgi:hypothetical protein